MNHPVDLAQKEVIEPVGDNSNNQTGRRCNQRFPDTAGQNTGIYIPLKGLYIHKCFNHTGHRSCKTDQWSDTGNGSQPVHSFFKVKYLFLPGIAYGVFNIANRTAQPSYTRFQNASQRFINAVTVGQCPLPIAVFQHTLNGAEETV